MNMPDASTRSAPGFYDLRRDGVEPARYQADRPGSSDRDHLADLPRIERDRQLFFVIKEFGIRLNKIGSLLGRGVCAHSSVIPFQPQTIHAAASGCMEELPTLQEMAAEHVKEILQRHPTGPCTIGGYCAEGLLAVEVARQLESQGRRIDALILVDTMLIAGSARWRSRWVWLRNNLRFTLDGGFGYVRLKLQSARIRLKMRRAPDSIDAVAMSIATGVDDVGVLHPLGQAEFAALKDCSCDFYSHMGIG